MGIGIIVRFNVDKLILASGGPAAGIGQGGVDKRYYCAITTVGRRVHTVLNFNRKPNGVLAAFAHVHSGRPGVTVGFFSLLGKRSTRGKPIFSCRNGTGLGGVRPLARRSRLDDAAR